MRSFVRSVTVVAIAAAAFAGAAAGSLLLAFEFAAEPVRAEAAGAAPVEPFGFWRKPPDAKATLAPWTAVPGTASTARTLVAADPAGDPRAAARLLDLTALLAVQPTDGAAWLALAESTRATGMAPAAALAAYDMSLATARREPAPMLGRAVHVIRAWSDMDAARRTGALQGLAEIKLRLGKPAREALAAAVATMPPEVRSEIAADLPSALAVDKTLMKALGL